MFSVTRIRITGGRSDESVGTNPTCHSRFCNRLGVILRVMLNTL